MNDKTLVTFDNATYEVFKEETVCGKHYYMAERNLEDDTKEYVAGMIDKRFEAAGSLFLSADVVSHDYCEITDWFYGEIHEEIQQIKEKTKDLSKKVFTDKDCHSIYDYKSLAGQIVVMDADIMYKEYRRSEYQLFVAKGGFGCNPHGSGNAIFAENLYTHEERRIEKYDIVGVIKSECLPEWAKKRYEEIQHQKNKGYER